MSRAERPNLDIDALLGEQQATSSKVKEILSKDLLPQVIFRPVTSAEIKKFTDEVRFYPEQGKLVERLNDLKQSALKLVLIGENGKLVSKDSEYFPGSKQLVDKAYNVKRLNNDSETIDFRNDVLSHVLSTNTDKIPNLSDSLKNNAKAIQKRYTLLQESFAELPPKLQES